ncbi:hypothetical protein [Methyloversatilis sp. XJ19-49]|uniref:hypothetical protein n=1 Tax=Methyloversatilis sp. XJ19-49 TaxID=2963429 RepID=UPI00211BDD65|nr:hypothetical protein [Methyloversatilis sp. XJ19-49]MCQ9378840.1 hypothetical protein [Methyloversatilis sp. XJ19-49]
MITETIEWITDEALPDAEELVLVEIEGEGVWPGSCDGHHWINADGFPIERELIIAWARMPLGSKDGV